MAASAVIIVEKPSKIVAHGDETRRSDKAVTPPTHSANTPASVASGGRRFLCVPRWEAGVTDY